MKTIVLDDFTNLIAVIENEEIIDYCNTVEEALRSHHITNMESDLSVMKVSIDNNVVIKVANQSITLSKDQAISLRDILSSL